MPSAQLKSRQTRRKAERPGEILDAALLVFAEKGFAAARLDDIAARAGVTKGTIYLYFPGKEHLFKALIQDSISPKLQAAAAMVAAHEGSARDLLRMVLTQMGDFIATSNRIVLPKIIMAESGNFPDLARYYRDEVVARGLSMLEGIVARGTARGEFRAVPPNHAARLCVAPLIWMALWRASFAQFDAAPFDYARFVESHIETLLRGLAAEGATP